MTPVAAADEVELRAGAQVIRISTASGLPVAWTVCDEACDRAGSRRATLIGPGDGSMAWAGKDTVAAPGGPYTAVVTESDEALIAVLTALPADGGAPRVQRYEIPRRAHGLQARLTVPAGAALQLRTGAAFVPESLAGFGAAFTGVQPVRVGAGGQDVLVSEPGGEVERQAARGEWLGIRAHFWAWLLQPGSDTAVRVSLPAADQPAVQWQFTPGTHEISIYAGPVEWKSLRVVAPELGQLLFAALWEPLRWLCFGLFFLLGWITGAVSNVGLAIVLLSLAVKIILWPLTRIADRWQDEVNRIQSRLQPKLDAIRREFNGEEAHNRTLAVYREEGVHTLYTLKSLAGFAIQVPMFIAAFDMLADNFALSGASFLWIEDLAKPDRWLALPMTLPFFGGHLNLLPCLMTGLTILSAMLQADASLTAELARRQRRRLYAMAGAFFLLFYTFPAGMVLYWTANNAWHLVKIQLMKLLPAASLR